MQDIDVFVKIVTCLKNLVIVKNVYLMALKPGIMYVYFIGDLP